MIELLNHAAIGGALNDHDLDVDLRAAIGRRSWRFYFDQNHPRSESIKIVVVEGGDAPEVINKAVGFAITGIDAEEPSYEWIEDHGLWFEVAYARRGSPHLRFCREQRQLRSGNALPTRRVLLAGRRRERSMKSAGEWLSCLLILCVALALLKAALIVLLIALALGLVLLFATRPRETLLYLGAAGLFGLASARPTAFIMALGIVSVAVAVIRAAHMRRTPLLLTDRRRGPPSS